LNKMLYAMNLSKTEFAAYLECPLKFYLMKQQNQNTTHGPRGRRDNSRYSQRKRRGIDWHKKLNYCLKKYKAEIASGSPPPDNISVQPILRRFWDCEQHRYAVDPDHWFPLTFELYLENPSQRGVLDRIDPIDDHSCCVVEYKSSPKSSGFLDEELLFYALLASESKQFKQQIGRTVHQVACYFYTTGEWVTQDVLPEELVEYKVFLKTIYEEILTGNWTRKLDCSLLREECSFSIVCTKIPYSLLCPEESFNE